jgi:hypothetical protein
VAGAKPLRGRYPAPSFGTRDDRLAERQDKAIEIFDDNLSYFVDTVRRSFPDDGATFTKLCRELVDAAHPEVGIVRSERANARVARGACGQAVEEEFNVITPHCSPLRRIANKVANGKAETIAVIVHGSEDIGNRELGNGRSEA